MITIVMIIIIMIIIIIIIIIYPPGYEISVCCPAGYN